MEKVIVFSLDDELYAVSIMSVKEIVHKTDLIPVPGSSQYVEGMMNLRGKVIPVINLMIRLGLDGLPKQSFSHIVVIELSSTLFGIMVNGVSEVLSITSEKIQPVSETLTKKIDTTLFNGVIVDKERLILYLNPDTIFKENL